jgi:hypothetical protein
MYCGLEKRCRHKECTSVQKRPQQSRADSPVASAVASDTAAGLSRGPSGANGKSAMPPRGRVQPCVRPVEGAPMAADPYEVRGSDPNSLQRTRSAWTPRVSPSPGSTGLSSRLTTLHPPLDHRNASGRAGLRVHGRRERCRTGRARVPSDDPSDQAGTRGGWDAHSCRGADVADRVPGVLHCNNFSVKGLRRLRQFRCLV